MESSSVIDVASCCGLSDNVNNEGMLSLNVVFGIEVSDLSVL